MSGPRKKTKAKQRNARRFGSYDPRIEAIQDYLFWADPRRKSSPSRAEIRKVLNAAADLGFIDVQPSTTLSRREAWGKEARA